MNCVVDDLRRDLGGLLRVTLGVELLQLHLAARVGLVVLVDGQLHAVLDVDAEGGVGPVQRAGHGQRHRRAGRLAVTGGVGGVVAFGGLTSAPFSSIGTCSTIFRSVCAAPPSFDVDCCWQPAMPSATRPAQPRANALRATRPRTLHLRVSVSRRPSTSAGRPASTLREEHSQPVAESRDVGRARRAGRVRHTAVRLRVPKSRRETHS